MIMVLKFVPGVEAFYQDETLSYDKWIGKIDETKPVSQIVLHALNDDGWKRYLWQFLISIS